ncbi:MAG: 50S ribosomal protein L10 [Rickettsiales bacterium]|jgi:large subunit ribosomal protein L10|nr:50S ribosomal protein L10 [Rickettsiales bacterium]
MRKTEEMMNKQEKASLISNVRKSLGEAEGIFVIENHGLSVRETEQLRAILRPITSLFKVVKNRLMARALDGSPFAPISELLKRPTAVALASDPYAVAKALAAFAEAHPNLEIVGGQMDAGLMGKPEVERIAKLPSLKEIRGTIARIFAEPASRLARLAAEYGKK